MVLITIAFFLMHLMPGSPFSQEEQKKLTAEGLQRLKEKYGLDQARVGAVPHLLEGASEV